MEILIESALSSHGEISPTHRYTHTQSYTYIHIHVHITTNNLDDWKIYTNTEDYN